MTDEHGFEREPDAPVPDAQVSDVPDARASDEPVSDGQVPEAPTSDRTARIGARGVVLLGARIVSGLVGIAIAVAVVAGAGWLPLPAIGNTPKGVTVTPVPTDQQRVCAGPILRLGSDTGAQATTPSSIGTPYVKYASSEGRPSASQMKSTDNSTGVAPVEVTLPPTGATSSGVPLLSASQSERVDHGDLFGFAAAECREARGDSWLVGGSTTTGRTTLVTLSNPGDVNATVTLTIYTGNGPVVAAGTDGIVVPPGGQRILSLAGFAPGAISPVVRVQSRGSLVVANLQQAVVRTLEPGGVDVVGAVDGPAKVNVIPGLVLSTADTIAARENAPGYEDLASVLRFFVPGKHDAHATITIAPESGTGKATTVKVTLDADKVTETPLGDFAAGSYTVTARADVPIVAAARSSRYDETASGSASVDFGWFGAAPALTRQALVAVGEGPSPQLHLANPTDAAATVTVKQQAAPGSVTSYAVREVTVPAHGAIALPAYEKKTYLLGGFDQLMVAVTYNDIGALAGYTVSPTGPASQPVTVFRR